MKMKLFILALFMGMFTLNSCQKEYMGPVDENGAPLQLRGGEEQGDPQAGAGGITDGGHDSDYDGGSSKARRKSVATTN